MILDNNSYLPAIDNNILKKPKKKRKASKTKEEQKMSKICIDLIVYLALSLLIFPIYLLYDTRVKSICL